MFAVQSHRVTHVAETLITIAPLLAAGGPVPLQKVRAVIKPSQPGQLGRQKRRLVVAALEQPAPMQRYRGDQHFGLKDGLRGPKQPACRRAREIKPVSVFQRQNHVARAILIQHCRTAARPWPRHTQAIVTVHSVVRISARQRCSAQIADQPGDERRFAPTHAAQAEIRCHHGIAGNALGRIDHVQRGLQSRHVTLMFRAMQTPPLLTDRAALSRNRARATAFFLHEEVADEAKERLNEVNRAFTRTAVVTPFPDLWPDFGTRVADDDMLGLEPGQQDLVIHALGLHWANDPVGQLVQCRHALVPDGLFLGFMFGGQTLHELRACLAEAEAAVTGGLSPRVVPMGEIRDLGGLLQRAGFSLPVADSFTKTVRYRDALHLMHDLRAMGEGNALHGRLRRPTQRQIFLQAASLYQQRFADAEERITATFEIICLTGWAPHDSQQKPLRPGSAAQRLADALQTTEMPLPRVPREG